ncbi:MAG: hypothetical protein M3Z25_17565 [Actinomycetota bacterium]|nr:hypothetical protein [Actinomycetota bacterium]
MLGVTGWVLRTWFKVTAALVICVGLVWLFTDQTRYVWQAGIAATLIDMWAIRALAREWSHEARSSWWWT